MEERDAMAVNGASYHNVHELIDVLKNSGHNVQPW